MYRKIILIILPIVIFATGCSNNLGYSSFEDKFEKLYYEVASVIDIEHAFNSVKKLQSDNNIQNIKEMKNLLDTIKGNVPTSNNNDVKQLEAQYEGIAFLQGTYSRWDSLTNDEKRKFNTELWRAYDLYRDHEKVK